MFVALPRFLHHNQQASHLVNHPINHRLSPVDNPPGNQRPNLHANHLVSHLGNQWHAHQLDLRINRHQLHRILRANQQLSLPLDRPDNHLSNRPHNPRLYLQNSRRQFQVVSQAVNRHRDPLIFRHLNRQHNHHEDLQGNPQISQQTNHLGSLLVDLRMHQAINLRCNLLHNHPRCHRQHLRLNRHISPQVPLRHNPHGNQVFSQVPNLLIFPVSNRFLRRQRSHLLFRPLDQVVNLHVSHLKGRPFSLHVSQPLSLLFNLRTILVQNPHVNHQISPHANPLSSQLVRQRMDPLRSPLFDLLVVQLSNQVENPQLYRHANPLASPL